MPNLKTFKKIGFIGLGLLGGSIAKLIKSEFPNIELFAITNSQETIKQAKSLNIIHDGNTSISCLPKDLDLVFICTPISLILPSIEKITNHITNPNLIITDIASVKEEICSNIPKLKFQHLFIPGHPMAGTEKTGFIFSDKQILKDAPYILIPQKDKRYDLFKSFINKLFFNTIEMKPSQHDKLVCLASHIPYLLSCLTVSATSELAKKENDLLKSIISTGFRDTTRVAQSAANWGTEVCQANNKSIINALENTKNSLENLIELVKNSKDPELFNWLSSQKSARNNLYT
jgi:prephenate dehydrogenase